MSGKSTEKSKPKKSAIDQIKKDRNKVVKSSKIVKK